PGVTSLGTMSFDADHCFVLTTVETMSTQGKRRIKSVARLQYEGEWDGFPRLKKRTAVATVTQENGDVNTSESVTEFELRVDANVPDTEFTLAAFGLPDPKGLELERPSRNWIWWGIAGAVMMGTAIWLLRRRTSRQMPGTPGDRPK